jgi:hypothetical protein
MFTGWYVSDGDRDWQYRMSLYYVKPEDANTFTCQTPRRQTNSVKIVVTGKNVFESLSLVVGLLCCSAYSSFN